VERSGHVSNTEILIRKSKEDLNRKETTSNLDLQEEEAEPQLLLDLKITDIS